MKNLTLSLTLTTLLALALNGNAAQASTECAGETYGGLIAHIRIDTMGTMGYIQGAEVTFTPKDGQNVRRYSVKSDEIPQFFETVDGAEYERATVGLAAYVQHESPIHIRYVGTNYERDLTEVLRDPSRKKQPGNSFRVWKGPGFSGSEQHSFQDVVCAVSLDP